jgi:hypothetical protein
MTADYSRDLDLTITVRSLQESLRSTAHAAVLAEVPSFQKLLHQDWARKSFGLSNKLEVQLPYDVSQEDSGSLLEARVWGPAGTESG